MVSSLYGINDISEEHLETLNDASAIWTKAKSDITKEQHAEFFRQTGGGFGDPLLTIHNKAEGGISYTSLVYIPENIFKILFKTALTIIALRLIIMNFI